MSEQVVHDPLNLDALNLDAMNHDALDQQARQAVEATRPVPTLHLAEGDRAGTVFRLDDDSVTIGRRRTNGIVLDHPAVSRVHARIAVQGSAVVVTDLSSTAGTTVEDRPVEGPRILRHGNRVAFGPVTLVFEDPSAMGTIEEVTQVVLAAGEVPQPTLSPRQSEIVKLMAEGHSNREIADVLGLTHRTVKSYASEIYGRLGVPNRAGAVALAIRHDLM